ncbi:hypothetical protein C4D60_Mb07t21620 [Musa balbisiana]|uniref:Uncharacterized protein n=1 Tax=Musa balbisiana TaxID=52838 RepID=A0A4S8JH05_MUSBA|nr:hypothetical protein C4D60_Mb07t21620 [Musa balbisiana]
MLYRYLLSIDSLLCERHYKLWSKRPEANCLRYLRSSLSTAMASMKAERPQGSSQAPRVQQPKSAGAKAATTKKVAQKPQEPKKVTGTAKPTPPAK